MNKSVLVLMKAALVEISLPKVDRLVRIFFGEKLRGSKHDNIKRPLSEVEDIFSPSVFSLLSQFSVSLKLERSNLLVTFCFV